MGSMEASRLPIPTHRSLELYPEFTEGRAVEAALHLGFGTADIDISNY